MAHEGGFEAIDDDLPEVVKGQSEGLSGDEVLPGEGRARDQSIVRIECDPDALIKVILERMLLQAAYAFGMHIAGEADFQSQTMVIHIAHKLLVFPQPSPVPYAVGAAVVDGLVNALRSEGFTGVQGGIDIVLQYQ